MKNEYITIEILLFAKDFVFGFKDRYGALWI